MFTSKITFEMEKRFEPHRLEDCTSDVCPCCNSSLQKRIKKGKYLINECGDCTYADRPFCSSGRYGGCSCVYGEKEFFYITCNTCCSPKCVKCSATIYCCHNNDCKKALCYDCNEEENERREKIAFNRAWKTSKPHEKLHLYGIVKLKLLSKNKKLKGYSKLNKEELIDALTPLVNESDFPIK